MKKVIDANFFQDPDLEDYLKLDKGNIVVFSDYACMEAYKGNALKNISKSLEIVSKFPEQVLVLKGTRDVVKLTLTSDGFKKLVDTDQTKGFRIFCFHTQRAILGDVDLATQILKKGQIASSPFNRLKKDAEVLANGIEGIAKSFKKEHLRALKKREKLDAEMIDKIIREILLLTAFLFQGHPDVHKIPQAEQVRNSYIFRFAVSNYLLALRWISDGGLGKVKMNKLRNDIVDMNYVAYATFFDGLMTRDSKLKEIYQETCFFLKNAFETEPGI